MEVLTLLRQCTMSRKTAKEDGNYYMLGHRRVPKDAPTAWKSQVGNEVRTQLCVLPVSLEQYNKMQKIEN